MSNSVPITRLPLDPEQLGQLVEKLPGEVFEQLTHNSESKLRRSRGGRQWMVRRDRSNKRGERAWGVDKGWKVFLANQRAPGFATKTEGGAEVFYERRLLQVEATASGGGNFRNAINS